MLLKNVILHCNALAWLHDTFTSLYCDIEQDFSFMAGKPTEPFCLPAQKMGLYWACNEWHTV